VKGVFGVVVAFYLGKKMDKKAVLSQNIARRVQFLYFCAPIGVF
jgi:hypothetical protein